MLLQLDLERLQEVLMESDTSSPKARAKACERPNVGWRIEWQRSERPWPKEFGTLSTPGASSCLKTRAGFHKVLAANRLKCSLRALYRVLVVILGVPGSRMKIQNFDVLSARSIKRSSLVTTKH